MVQQPASYPSDPTRSDLRQCREVWSQGTSPMRWQVSDLDARVYPGSPRVMPNTVTYRFENGWTATGDLPCREALRTETATRDVTLPDLSYPEIHLCDPSGRVDYSDFCHLPEWRVRHAKLGLHSDTDQTLHIRCETAGAVHVWYDGQCVHRFEPFARNDRQMSEFRFKVTAGVKPLIVRFEDLHERDTIFGFRLELLEGQGLSCDIAQRSDPTLFEQAAKLLDGLRSDQVFYDGSCAAITSEQMFETPFVLTCDEALDQPGTLSLTSPEFHLDLAAGCRPLGFSIDLEGARLRRSIGVSVLEGLLPLKGGDYDTRCAAMLSRMDCGDDIVFALRAAAQDRWDAKAQVCFDQALDKVNSRHDCADFRMMSLLWIWGRYRHRLSEDNADRLQQAIIGFRYWLDEPGNDVMWFWSENHALCFHIAQFLAGQMFPETRFPASGRLGTEQDRLGQDRLHQWFDAIDTYGLSEWNSSAYYPIHYRGLLALFTLSQDPSLTQRAKDLMDKISKMVALHHAGGVAVGTQGRIYEKELLAGPMTELGSIASLMFGGWHVPGKDAAAGMMAVSDYRPDPALGALAFPTDTQRIRATYRQGHDEDARLYLFKTPAVQLSSINNLRPGSPGHQQHVVDLQFSGHPMARIWINHPGVLRHWAEARPSFWAGNGRLPEVVQHNGTVAMVYYLKDEDIGFTHVFLPKDHLDELIIEENWIFARCGDGYAAIWSHADLQVEHKGLYQGYEVKQAGPVCAWALKTGDASDGSFESFMMATRLLPPHVVGGVLTVPTETGGIRAGHTLHNQPHNQPPKLSIIPTIEISPGPTGTWRAQQEDKK